MTFGGLFAGLAVALVAGAVSRSTIQAEDASLAAFYLTSLALGVLLISLKGSSLDLMNVLFGTVLGVDNQALLLIGTIAATSVVAMTLMWRTLVAECVDPVFLRSVSRAGPVVHLAFLVLVVSNLVAGFEALGTLLAVGLMMLPAAAARFWTRHLLSMCAVAVAIGIGSSALGLLLSYHLGAASGPAIVLTAGAAYVASLLFGRRGVLANYFALGHRTA
jgi:zinc/manganese transport system permease protein